MKTEDYLILGALGVGAYYFLNKKEDKPKEEFTQTPTNQTSYFTPPTSYTTNNTINVPVTNVKDTTNSLAANMIQGSTSTSTAKAPYIPTTTTTQTSVNYSSKTLPMLTTTQTVSNVSSGGNKTTTIQQSVPVTVGFANILNAASIPTKSTPPLITSLLGNSASLIKK